MRENFKGTGIYNANIYHQDGHVDGGMLVKYLDEVFISGDLKKLDDEIIILENSIHLPEGHKVRINSIKNAVSVFRKEYNELIQEDQQSPVNLIPFNSTPIQLEEINANICKTLPPMLYRLGPFSNSISTFHADFKNSPCLIDKLKVYGFDKKIPSNNPFMFRIMKNVDIHAKNRNFYAYVQDIYFDKTNSGRLTKKTFKTTLSKKYKYIDEAILLPIPHTTRNYYHVLSEMIYSISKLQYFDCHIPVIYCEDRFDILPYICERLQIDFGRFHSFDSVSDTRINRAYSVLSANFFWDKNFYGFFKQICPAGSKPEKNIYISRRKSARPLLNESEVEDILSNHGFDVIFAEDLTFQEQVSVFSSAKTLISSHGAGMSNIAFMNSGTSIVEIFTDKAIVEHFYLRSRHNEMKYMPIFAENNKLETTNLLELLRNNNII